MPLTSDDIVHLYDQTSEPMLRYLTRRTLDAQVAMDIVGETFAVAYEKRARFKGDPATAGPGWLFGIAKNVLSDFFRSGRIEQRAMRRLDIPGVQMPDEEIGRIEQLAGSAEIRAVVADALSALSEPQRDALQLRIVEELSYPEVAARLDVSEDVARSRVSRGLSKLRRHLEPLYPEKEFGNA